MWRFIKEKVAGKIAPYVVLAFIVIVIWNFVSSWGSFVNELDRFKVIVTPFLWGILIAYMINLPISAIQRLLDKVNKVWVRQNSRVFSIVIFLVIVLSLVILVFSIIIPEVYSSIILFVNQFGAYQVKFMETIEIINELELPEFFGDVSIDIIGFINTLVDQGAKYVKEFDTGNAATALTVIGKIFGSVFSTVFHGVLAVISAVFFVAQRDSILKFVKRVLNISIAANTNRLIFKYLSKLNENCKIYIRTQTIDGFILGFLMTIILVVAGSPYFLLIGLMLGVINYIPYFGSIIGTTVALIIVAFTQDIKTALILLPIMFLVQQLDGNFIQPKLMGGSFKTTPLLIIISVTVGGAYAGVFGMLMAIPIVVVVRDMIEDILTYYEHKAVDSIVTDVSESDSVE